MAPEISTPRPYDEARLARASKLVQASYAALNLALLTHYALSRDLYHTGLALGTLALFPVMHAFYRLTRLKRVHQMDIFIYMFTLIAYTGAPTTSWRTCYPAALYTCWRIRCFIF